MAFDYTRGEISEYVKKKSWYWYVPVWLLGTYIFYMILQFHPNKPTPFIIALPATFDFALHELAHVATGFLPSLITASAGSFSELLLGVLLVYGAFKTRCYFTAMVCFLWLMLAAQSAGIYMADARAQHMELVSLGGALSGEENVIHDWHYIFGELHVLKLDTVIGNTVRGIGIAAGAFGLGFAAWLIYRMAASSEHKALPDKEAELLQSAQQTGTGIDTLHVKHPSPDQAHLFPEPTKGRLAEPPPQDEPASHDKKPTDSAYL